MGMKLRNKETNDSTSTLMHVEFRGGEKDFLLLFSFEFLILESDEGLEKKLRRPCTYSALHK